MRNDVLDKKPLSGLSQGSLAQLEEALVQRDIRRGFAVLDSVLPADIASDPPRTTSISLVLCLAQWVDLGYRDLGFFKNIQSGLLNLDQRGLSALDFFRLLLLNAYLDLSHEQLEGCVAKLAMLLQTALPVLPEYLIFVAHFWKGRAHRKRAEYEQARAHILEAQVIAGRLRSPQLVAVTQIHESWLAFQKGERPLAFQLLDAAQEVLRPTGHALSLGNIESARGRYIRRSGEYARALSHFEAAITIYRSACPDHPNLARVLVNAAYVKRLLALKVMSDRKRKRASGLVHARSLQLTQEALALLDQARRIYNLHHHQGGTGSVLVNVAQLHLESGAIEEAEVQAGKALNLANETGDQVLLARAQVVCSAVCLARVEEQLGEDLDVEGQAHLAVSYAEAAIALAAKMQNKRLLAEAHIARGQIAAADFFCEWQTAKDHVGKAAALLTLNDRDHLAQLLGDLKVRIYSKTEIEETLMLWSAGELGSKTFQQVQEEFAQLVIPKVWVKYGRNVTLVAKNLSMSPKKIRRILRSVE